ncbi:MAG TPA: ATP-binding protein, partial [Gemmataceae bacterium]
MARPDGHTDYFNRRWYEFTGFPEGEGAGAGWTPVLHPDDVGRCLELWYAAVRSGRPYEIEYRFKDRATGGYRWFLTRALPVRDAAGNVVRWFGTCTDIHDQKQAEEAQRFLAEASAAFVGSLDDRAVLQRVAELAVPALADFCFFDVVADDGAITRVGWHHGDPAKRERFEGFLRFVPTQQSEGHPVPAAIASGRPVLVPEVTDAWVRSLAPGPEHLRLLRDLRLRSLMTVPLCIGEQRLGALTFCYGESGRRHTRLELYLAEELARRAALTVQNARLYARLREADRRKDEFLAVLAHELRNPLAAMRNATEVARLLPAGDAQWRWAHGVIDRQSARLARLVDDLLDVSRITRGKIPLRLAALDLGAVAAEAVETVRPLVEARRHELRVDLPPRPVRVLGDPARIEQVLANLLHNAAKYTEVGGRITLAVRPDGPDAVVSVADTGIGVPPEMLPRLFDMFAQVEGSVERSQGGLGIGLTLVKRLVEMHGGTVAAASDGPGTGSEFTVRLPALPEAAPAPVPAGPPPVARRARARRRVLVIDDNIDCADSLAVLLRLWGHEVEVSHDGMAGLEAVPAFAPDVVLLDIGLPKMDGLQVARGLRGRPDLPPVLLVAMTGYGQEDDRRRTREAGFDHHLVKPIDPEVLQALLDGAAP